MLPQHLQQKNKGRKPMKTAIAPNRTLTTSELAEVLAKYESGKLRVKAEPEFFQQLYTTGMLEVLETHIQRRTAELAAMGFVQMELNDFVRFVK